ncbi:hypothetical protein [Acidipila sp. EB88]|uniref:hypothetical protein n=1 Tax=Acidipila sp. EB88 TaxID=2305226 RepID=UPI000F5DB9C1|nr:hypothetical protein [Acidipila sp. EB88]RRA48220.1 hypothetical protein D1Y84_07895 [Acidipila sp. EB88]
MQDAQDSFYIALRDRLLAFNPNRVMTLRAVKRPGILVEASEAPVSEMQNDIFVLRWSGLSVLHNLPRPLVSMTCEIRYATSGSQAYAGLDRGRALAEMDRELMHILRPLRSPKLSFSSTPAIALQTQVFWNVPEWGVLETERDQMLRTVTVTVFSFEEKGEA